MAVAPQNIMAQLRGMPDAQLAQYAAMHKSDPFIFPLAFQESQSRKQLRASQQAQMAGQEQPKVVDQAVSQMMPQQNYLRDSSGAPVVSGSGMPIRAGNLPEDTGIGQLPAKNLQRMAGGGIVAFEEGGEVPRYNGVEDGSVVKRGFNQYAPSGYGNTLAAPPSAEEIAEYNEATRKGFGGNLSDFLGKVRSTVSGFFPDTKPLVQNLETTTRLEKNPEKTAGSDFGGLSREPTGNMAGSRRTPLQLAEEAAKTKAGPKTQVGAQDRSGISNLVPAAPGASKAQPAAAAQSGLGSIAEYAKEANDYAGADPTAKQLSRVEKQEAGAAGEKKDALNMALLKAGLGMMAGTSRHAFENIGKGAMAGAEDYSAAMKDLKKAGLERDKMRDAAEQAAYAYKRDDVKGYRAAQEKVADRKTEMEKAQLAASTTLQAAGISASAQIRAAGMPGAQERLFASLGGGDVTKGLKVFQEAQTDKTGLGFAKLYVDHVTDSRKAGADPMSEQDFLATMSRLSAQMNPKIVKDPKGDVLAR